MDYAVLQLVDMQRVMRTRQPWAHTVRSRLLFLWLPAAIWWHWCFMLSMCSSGARWLRKLCPANSGMTRQVCLAYLFLRCFSISNSLSPLVRDYYLKSICADCDLFTTEGVCLSFPLSAVSLDQNAYTMDLSLKVEGSEYHLQCIFVDCQSVETEGGNYGKNHSVQFYRLDWKT